MKPSPIHFPGKANANGDVWELMPEVAPDLDTKMTSDIAPSKES